MSGTVLGCSKGPPTVATEIVGTTANTQGSATCDYYHSDPDGGYGQAVTDSLCAEVNQVIAQMQTSGGTVSQMPHWYDCSDLGYVAGGILIVFHNHSTITEGGADGDCAATDGVGAEAIFLSGTSECKSQWYGALFHEAVHVKWFSIGGDWEIEAQAAESSC